MQKGEPDRPAVVSAPAVQVNLLVSPPEKTRRQALPNFGKALKAPEKAGQSDCTLQAAGCGV